MFWKKKKRVIVLTSPISAGKTTVVSLLMKHKFRSYRFSDAIKNEIEKQGLDIKEPINFRDVGNQMRSINGCGILSELGIKGLQRIEGRLVFDGARHPEEIQKLKDEYGKELLVVSISSPFKNRYARFSDKLEDEDYFSEEEFKKVDDKESASIMKCGHQVIKCMAMADYVIYNDSDLLSLENQVNKMITKHF